MTNGLHCVRRDLRMLYSHTLVLPSSPASCIHLHPLERFMKNRAEWPDSCSQDMIYPTLAMNILCLGARTPRLRKLHVWDFESPRTTHSDDTSSTHPGVPESLAFNVFWPLKVSEGQGATFAEFLLWAFEFQELKLLGLKRNRQKVEISMNPRNIFQRSHVKL